MKIAVAVSIGIATRGCGWRSYEAPQPDEQTDQPVMGATSPPRAKWVRKCWWLRYTQPIKALAAALGIWENLLNQGRLPAHAQICIETETKRLDNLCRNIDSSIQGSRSQRIFISERAQTNACENCQSTIFARPPGKIECPTT